MMIVKRTGELVNFDSEKICRAVLKAFHSSKEVENIEECSNRVTSDVISNLGDKNCTVEMVQDEVEKSLMKNGFFSTAKLYILYRVDRTKIRPQIVDKSMVDLFKQSAEYFENDTMREFVYYRTYSRYIPSLNRRECWVETVDRYMSFMRENLGNKLMETEYSEIREAILKQQVMPSMRLLQFAGDAARRCNVCVYNCSYTAPENFKDLVDILYLSASGTGVGYSVESIYADKFPIIQPQKNPKVIHKHVVGDSKEAWCDAFEFGLNAWYSGEDVEFDYSKVRPAGAPIRTMGGRSSGPGPLMDLMDFSRSTIVKRAGSKLTTLQLYDIICKIAQIVVAGGMRRSATLMLSDLGDAEIRDAKKGAFWVNNPQRSMANNSAVYNTKPSMTEFMREWLALAESQTGERGIFNRGGLPNLIPKRRLDVIGENVKHLGVNPCVTADTWVQTVLGPRQVHELIGKKIDLVVNGSVHPMESEGFFHTGYKQVYEVETDQGYRVKLTSDHPLLLYDKIKKEGKWTKLEKVPIGETIMLSNHRNIKKWDGTGTFEEGWLLGEIVGDGGIVKGKKGKSDSAYLRFWGENQVEMKDLSLLFTKKYVKHRADLTGSYNQENKTSQVLCTGLYLLCQKYGLSDEKLVLPELEKTSYDFYRGFIRGFFDADGSVQGSDISGYSIRLAQSELTRLYAIHRMLTRLGIGSKVYKGRRAAQKEMMADGKGGRKEYECKEKHELIISCENIKIFYEIIGFYEKDKMEKLRKIVEARYKDIETNELSHSFYNEVTLRPLTGNKNFFFKKEHFTNQTSATRKRVNRYGYKFYDKITKITALGEENVYDVTVSDVHEFCANGIRVSNCSEILLQPKGFCNLSEVVCRSDDNMVSLMKKARIATILGTYQATLTNFKYIHPKWTENQKAERLLGVSLTGQWDCSTVREEFVLRHLKDYCIQVNLEYAKRFGISQSTSITAVKPSGSVSQLTNSASGIHPRFSKYYIRRIRISATDPLLKLMRDQGFNCNPEVGQTEETCTTFVLDFPIKAPENAICTKDLTAIEQLEYWKKVRLNYVEHNPSITVYIKEDEWLLVGQWVWQNWDSITGISFLPYSDHVYKLAPYEEISKEEYEKLASKMTKVDFSKLVYYEKIDCTDVKREYACTGDKCELN